MYDREIVLSYYDSIIRQADYKVLYSKEWITDNLIEFWFEYLSNDLFEQYNQDLLCFSPSLSQLIKLTYDLEEIKIILEPLEISSKKLILIPINDSMSYESIGGTHWSLMAFLVEENKFEHYDSTTSGNIIHAENIVSKLKKIFWKNIDLNIVDEHCHRQDNSYNCGIHLICNSEAICRKYLLKDERKIIELTTPEMISGFRKKLIEIIQKLKRKSNN